MIERNNFITVQGWMVTDLHLSGSELLCYALIYGFSQDNQSVFSGTASYIAEWLNINRRQVIRILQNLVEKQLIEKIEKKVNGVLLVDYKVAVLKDTGCDILSQGCDIITHHNITDNTDNIEKKNNIIINNNITKRKETVLNDQKIVGLVELLKLRIEDRYNRKLATVSGWYDQMRLLVEHDKVEPERIIEVMNWHFSNMERPYCHVILSARAFREKFISIETQMKKHEQPLFDF